MVFIYATVFNLD